jgi:hypothetical protein
VRRSANAVLVVCLLTLGAALAAPAPDASAPDATPPADAGSRPTPAILSKKLNSSDTCGACHKAIERAWRTSAHAQAMEDPVFLDAFRETVAREGSQVSRICLSCHAPLAEATGDLALQEKTTWEGVSCDVCHSMTAVDLSGGRPHITFDLGIVKRGPIRDAESMAHEVAYSELHTTSLGCAGCHEWSAADGTPVMSTYTEWLSSSAAREGRACQNCHMATTRADVVDPRVLRTPHAEVNLHDVPGGHSLEQLHKALAVGIRPTRSGDDLSVEVTITNKGAGHAVPTGMPGRRVLLEVSVESSQGGGGRDSRTYGRVYVDAEGKPILRDSAFFAKGVRLKEDTRIKPDERRVENFHFDVPAGATAFLTLKLHYEHAPMGNEQNRTFVTFFSEDRTLPPASAPGHSLR